MDRKTPTRRPCLMSLALGAVASAILLVALGAASAVASDSCEGSACPAAKPVREVSTTPDALSGSGSSAAATPDHAALPTVRGEDADAAPTGAEPDPESFDRRGLETWWERYRGAGAAR
jgi:hypothetical protein